MPKTERLNLRLDKDVRAWLAKAARLSRAPSVSEYARRIIYAAYEQRHSERKRAL